MGRARVQKARPRPATHTAATPRPVYARRNARTMVSVPQDNHVLPRAAARNSMAPQPRPPVNVSRPTSQTVSVATWPAAGHASRANCPARMDAASSSIPASPIRLARPTLLLLVAQLDVAMALGHVQLIRPTPPAERRPARAACCLKQPRPATAKAPANQPRLWIVRPIFAAVARATVRAPRTITASLDTRALRRRSAG